MSVRAALRPLVAQLDALQPQIGFLEKTIHAQHKRSEVSRRLETIPGVGVIVATALTATVTDPGAFKSGRDLAAWIGLVPRQRSSGGKERLGSISKQGDRYLRKLMVGGASAVVRYARQKPGTYPWLDGLLARRPAKVVIVALANKIARITWVIMARGETYRAPLFAAGAAKGSAMGA